jgi:serine/threonine-protein kinase
MAASQPPIGPVRRFGRYTLVKKLATGGMAEIWLARQRGLAGFNRFVVIKKILSHLSEQETFVKMFLDEARMSAQLNHPNVVQIYDLGREADSYYIAMEFIAGENLAAIAWRGMKRGRPFPPPYAARVIADACKALHYAHHLKGSDGQPLEIVHRDISPQNLLVTYEGEVKVVDFGIAKAKSKTEHTKTGMLKGKFSYMSPEQCLGAPIDMRSDVFALGILLYELCTGKRLFKHESELMILEMITKRSVVPPSQVAAGISARLEDIIMQALEKDTAMRFQTAQAMQVALEEYLRDENHQATNPDIAQYMRDLFNDKIEEKRRLKELASRDDFEVQFSDEETEQNVPTGAAKSGSDRRRVVHGLPPSQVNPAAARSSPMMHPGMTGTMMPPGSSASPVGFMQPGLTPQGYPMPPGSMHGYPPGTYPGYPGSLSGNLPTEGSSWVARLVIAGALIVILVASAILYQQLNTPAEPLPQQTRLQMAAQPQLPRKTGSLTLESVPNGAVIHLDGKPMALPNGENAKTPSDLHSLQYGMAYAIKLTKPGYETYETTITMGEESDGKTIRPTLNAFPGKLVVEVDGENRRDVRIFIDNEDAGLGPRVDRQIAGNKFVVVEGRLPGHACDSERVRIAPNETKIASIACKKSGTRGSRAIAAADTRPPPPPPRNVEREPRKKRGGGGAIGSADCATDPDLPPGFVTISTTPHSDVFWNGRKLGQTPLARYKLPSGCVTITAKALGGGAEKTVRLTVEPNRVRIFKFALGE